MPVNGKTWSAIIVREANLPYGEEVRTLYYAPTRTTPEDIAETYPVADYPQVQWDEAVSWEPNAMRYRYLGHNYPVYWGGYPSVPGDHPGDQAAMLDTQRYDTYGSDVSRNGVRHLRWTDGVWRDYDIYDGSPEHVWAAYPDNPLLADATDAPFGFGYGLIRYQLLTRSDNLHTELPDPPDPLPGDGDQSFSVSYTDFTYIFTPTYDGLGPGEPGYVPEDGEGDGLTDESLRLRVWGFNLDGHSFAVFRIGPSESLIYDLTTGQFANWASPGRDNWRAHVGQNWIGMSSTTFANNFGSDVVCGDDASNVLYILDPTYGRDDRSTTGDDFFLRKVTGLITVDGRETVNCGAVTLSMSLGNPTQDGATINLETSDNLGQTWFDHGDNIIAAGEHGAVVEWRGLGLARVPGRLFRFTDNGACTRISSADLR